MPEIDSGQKINFTGFIELMLPYLGIELEEFWNKKPNDLKIREHFFQRIKRNIESCVGINNEDEEKVLEVCIEDILNRQEFPMQKWRFNKYYLREKLLIEVLNEGNLNPFKGGFPIIISGRSVSNENSFVKSGIEPYSKSHKLSNNVLEAIYGLYLENKDYKDFLERIFFIYLQPVSYIQMVRFYNEIPTLVDYLSLTNGTPLHLKKLSQKQINEYASKNDNLSDEIKENFVKNLFQSLEINFDNSDELFSEIEDNERKEGDRTYSDFSLEIFDFLSIKSSVDKNVRSYERVIHSLIERINELSKNSLELKKVKDDPNLNPFKINQAYLYQLNIDKYLSFRKAQTSLAKRIMAFKIAYFIDLHKPEISDFIRTYQTQGLPIFIEKTSYEQEIVRLIEKYSSFINETYNGINDEKNDKTPYNSVKGKNRNGNAKKLNGFEYIGGKHGPLEFAKDKSLGISDSSAIKKLCGFIIEKADIFYNGQNDIKGFNFNRFNRTNFPKIEYESLAQYPYFLLESNLVDMHPNISDLIDFLIKNNEISKNDLRLLDSYSKQNWTGWSRIEPRIVELFTNDTFVQIGLFSPEKRVGRWLEEISGKSLLYPLKEFDFEGFIVDEKECNRGRPLSLPDFRLSMFSLPTNPKLDKRIFNDNRVLSGCPIDKLITSLSNEKKSILLPGFSDSNMARKGNLIHLISSMEFFVDDSESNTRNELTHYKTLELLGISSQSPKAYCETPFRANHEYGANKEKVIIGFHPDAYFLLGYDFESENSNRFLGKEKRHYDIVVIDTKTNSFLPYFEHKYLLQTLSYGSFIKKMIEESTRRDCVENIYVVLNKNAFHMNMQKSNTSGTIRYRPQVFSPIVKFSKYDPFIELFKDILDESVSALMSVRKNPNESLLDYYLQSESEGYCDRCFYDHQTICENLRKNPLILNT